MKWDGIESVVLPGMEVEPRPEPQPARSWMNDMQMICPHCWDIVYKSAFESHRPACYGEKPPPPLPLFEC